MTNKQDTIATLGIEKFLNDRYMYRGNLRVGGYITFVQMLKAGMTDRQIADTFKVKQATAWRWHQRYEEEQDGSN